MAAVASPCRIVPDGPALRLGARVGRRGEDGYFVWFVCFMWSSMRRVPGDAQRGAPRFISSNIRRQKMGKAVVSVPWRRLG